MAILGLLFLAAAAVLGVETALSNRGDFMTVEAFDRTYSLTMSELFIGGVVCGAVAVFGLWLIVGSVARSRRGRMVAKHRVRAEDTQAELTNVNQTASELAEENDRLRNELAAERRSAATMGGVAVPPGAGNVPYGDQVSDAVRSNTISDTGHFDPYPAETGNGRAVDGRVADGAVADGRVADTDTTSIDTGSPAGVTGRRRGNR